MPNSLENIRALLEQYKKTGLTLPYEAKEQIHFTEQTYTLTKTGYQSIEQQQQEVIRYEGSYDELISRDNIEENRVCIDGWRQYKATQPKESEFIGKSLMRSASQASNSVVGKSYSADQCHSR